jgi:hypothetical protein
MAKPIFIIALLFSKLCPAQTKSYTYGNQVWYGYYPQIKLSNHWGIWNDWELHSKENFIEGASQFVFRLGATYYFTTGSKLTAGYGYTNAYPGDNHLYISQPEHFGWQQIQWFNTFHKKKLMQWIRLEERYRKHVLDNYTLGDNYDFSYRARYEAYYQLPLSKEGISRHHFSFAIGEEIYINFGKKIINNYFDQNRISAGLSYMVNNHDNLVLSYIILFQQLAAGNQYKSLNVIRLSFFENIELGHKPSINISDN